VKVEESGDESAHQSGSGELALSIRDDFIDRPNQGFHYECVGLLLTQCPVQGGSRYRQNKLSDFSPRNGSWL